MKRHTMLGLLLAVLVLLFATRLFAARAAVPLQTLVELTPMAYLPFVARGGACVGNVVQNGGFELGDVGWYTSTTGIGPKAHPLIGAVADGFRPHTGQYAARLGGYEGVWDVLTQTVTIPANGQLSFWWWMGTYETLPHHDGFLAQLISPEGSLLLTLASHDDQAVQQQWQQDVIDVSAYAGQILTLVFESYNDNYYFTWFDLDEICLCTVAGN
ncbi:MAG TPA: hypothetical protein PKZ84_23025 [Anaerolineae bacterium]|nr:hypothetical protein [Anaerolineae bacterium]HQI87644.1 hypothetical protein [Anaerolineae bacterium]